MSLLGDARLVRRQMDAIACQDNEDRTLVEKSIVAVSVFEEL